MITEQAVRDALHETHGVEPTDAGWVGVQVRAKAIRRRRTTVRVAAALAVIAAVTFIGVSVTDDTTRNIVAGPTTQREVVAVTGHNTQGDQLVVLSADDGHVIRTLVNGVGLSLGGTAVTPDGSTVYFTRVRHGLPCDTTEIARVPIEGGAIETVASPAAHPVVSPDGTELVWAHPADDDPCGTMSDLSRAAIGPRPGELVSEVEVSFGTSRIAPWSWSPDGTRLVAGLAAGDERWPQVATLAAPSLGQRVDLELPSAADSATYLPDGRLVVAFLDDATGGHRLVTFDPDSGTATRSIFDTPTSGIMVISADAAGDLLFHFGGDLLQRWHPGDARASTIATGVRDAAWVPGRT